MSVNVNTSLNGNESYHDRQINEECGAEEQEDLDPRIQIELERLNKSSAEVNKLENDLEVNLHYFIHDQLRHKFYSVYRVILIEIFHNFKPLF
jgi:hypothetical protein